MYEYFETMADMGIIAKGNTLNEAFSESAKALTNLMVDINTIEKKIKKQFTISSEDEYSLLYDFLTELLILIDSEFSLFCQYDIDITVHKNNKNEQEYILKCVAYGEELDKTKHQPKEEVKAITYHKMEIKNDNNEYNIRFIVDL
ncbi:archease [Methanococcus aeolicus]|uniref:archease n=1 Tax=Methanococcus aeolicus TaxID=42879 RepID=UPI0021C5AA82|nr:archease [Methanococcus aeolicus]UXM85215.1 archease [Methanococcus aeolicus]